MLVCNKMDFFNFNDNRIIPKENGNVHYVSRVAASSEVQSPIPIQGHINVLDPAPPERQTQRFPIQGPGETHI